MPAPRKSPRRGGKFPSEEAELRALPGVGAYTAAAIAAIAFGRQTAPVDGNIARILARLIALEKPIARARAELAATARALAPSKRAGDFAQALMDIGATLCRPRNPACGPCPLAQDCAARRAGVPEAYPRRAEAKASPRRQGAVFFARRADGAFLARRRPPHGLLASTVELPGSLWTAEGPRRRSSRSPSDRGALAEAAGDCRTGVHPFRARTDRLRRNVRGRGPGRLFLGLFRRDRPGRLFGCHAQGGCARSRASLTDYGVDCYGKVKASPLVSTGSASPDGA